MSNWLNKFRDDPNPDWLNRFKDDPQQHGKPPAPLERPQSMMLFGSLMATSLVIGLTVTAIGYPRAAKFATPVEVLLPDVLVIVIIGVFIYLVAGLRQIWAMWLLGAFCAARLLMYLPSFPYITPGSVQLLTAFYFMLQAAAFWFVFRPDSQIWLREKRSRR